MPLLLLTQQDTPGATGTANETRSTMGQGKNFPCASSKADEPEMGCSTNTPKMQSPSLLQASVEWMFLPSLESSTLHAGSLPGLHLLAGELGSLRLCRRSPLQGLRQGKENSEEKVGRGHILG